MPTWWWLNYTLTLARWVSLSKANGEKAARGMYLPLPRTVLSWIIMRQDRFIQQIKFYESANVHKYRHHFISQYLSLNIFNQSRTISIYKHTLPCSQTTFPRLMVTKGTPCTSMPSKMLKSTAWWCVDLLIVRVADGSQITISASDPTAIAPC